MRRLCAHYGLRLALFGLRLSGFLDTRCGSLIETWPGMRTVLDKIKSTVLEKCLVTFVLIINNVLDDPHPGLRDIYVDVAWHVASTWQYKKYSSGQVSCCIFPLLPGYWWSASRCLTLAKTALIWCRTKLITFLVYVGASIFVVMEGCSLCQKKDKGHWPLNHLHVPYSMFCL